MEMKIVSPFWERISIPVRQLATFILVFVWAYSGIEKFLNFQKSRNAFHNQTFPSELAEVLSYAVPLMEILLALLLVFILTRWWGLLGSLILLTVFNTYVGLIWWGAFPRVPCNCAGFIESMGWPGHFWFNSLLIAMTVFLLRIQVNWSGESNPC
jgi:uncharacterized membrane protein YphA (DoxX/SURF4 family)